MVVDASKLETEQGVELSPYFGYFRDVHTPVPPKKTVVSMPYFNHEVLLSRISHDISGNQTPCMTTW